MKLINWYKNLNPVVARAFLSLVGGALSFLAVWKPAWAPALVVVATALKSPLSDHPEQQP